MQVLDTALRHLRDPKHQTLLVVVICTVAAAAVWSQQRSITSSRKSLETNTNRLSRMRIDAAQIAELQSRPQQAVDRKKPNAELLGQVEAALSEANVPGEVWQDSFPQPPKRSKGSDYLRVATRLEFESVTIRQMVMFTQTLLQNDPTLSIESLRIRNRMNRGNSEAAQATWGIEITIAYLIYEPKSKDVV